MKKKILFTSILPGERFKTIMDDSRFEIKVLTASERKDLAKAVADFNPDALISLLSDKIDSSVIDAAPNLKVISNYAVDRKSVV